MSEAVTAMRLRFRAEDGRSLGGTWWPGRRAADHTILFLSGIATPRTYLEPLAGYLAEHGFGVLTFDYRGIGQSADPFSQDPAVTLDEWVNLDLPAALAEARRRSGARFLTVVAHSIGGQLLGQSPIRGEIDAAILIAAQRAIPRLFRGLARLRLQVGYAASTFLIRFLGHVPGCRWWSKEHCPGETFAQLARWSWQEEFTDDSGMNVEERFGDYRGPLVAIGFSDDRYYAPPPAVEALASLYRQAQIRLETIDPKAYGVRSIGHSGLFGPSAPRALWEHLRDELHELEQATAESGSHACA